MANVLAFLLVSDRRKDHADSVELIKARLESGEWQDDWPQVRAVVREHLGLYAVRVVERLAKEAKGELKC